MRLKFRIGRSFGHDVKTNTQAVEVRRDSEHQEELLQQALSSADEHALARAYVAITPSLRMYLSRILRDALLVDDAISNTWLTLIEKPLNWKNQGRGSALAWIYRIALNQVLSEQRRNIAMQRRAKDLPYGVLYGSTSDPELNLLKKVTSQEIAKIIYEMCSLTEQQVIFSSLEGHDVRTISKLLGTTDGNVRVIRHRVITRIRRALNVSDVESKGER